MKTFHFILFALTAIIVIAFALPRSVFAQQTSWMFSSTSSSTDGAWIHTRSSDDGTIVWGAGFDEMLELTPEQTNELQEFAESLAPSRPQEEMPQTLERMNKFRGITAMQTKLNQVLTPEQQVKYTEISFQASGGLDSWHLNDQLLEVVNLTDAQKDQIRKITTERETEIRAAMRQRVAGQPFDWQNATQEERDKRAAALVAEQNDNRATDEALVKKFAEQMQAVLTVTQRAKAEKLTAEAPVLVAKLLAKKQDASRPEQQVQDKQVPVYVPHSGSWQPGDPIPEGYRQERREGRFPRPVGQQ